MKRIFGFLSVVLIGSMFFACQDEVQQEVVYNLEAADILAPSQDYVADLDEYEPLTFEWSEAEWDGYGVVTYDIVFVREGGDFASPVMVFHSATTDSTQRTRRTLSKNEIKELYSAASLTNKDREVVVDWKVRTAAGGKRLESATVGKVKMTMTPDPDPFVVGNDIFIDGEGAAEAGQKMVYIPSVDYHFDARDYNDNSPYCKTFDYEIFTKLTAGKPIYFWSGTSSGDKDWFFALDGESGEAATTFTKSIRKDAVLTATVAADGVYRIRLNTVSGEVYLKKVNEVSFRWWPGPTDNVMEYVGGGKWEIVRTVPAKAIGYKFLFKGLDGDQPYGSEYPEVNLVDGSMNGVPENYWYVVSVKGGAAPALNKARANGTWRFPSEALGASATYTISMNADAGAYTTTIQPE